MSTTHLDLGALLVSRQALTRAQLADALRLQESTGATLLHLLVSLGHATEADILRAGAAALAMQYIDLAEITTPPAVIELVPESVARENIVLPLAVEGRTISIVLSDPDDFDVIQKLQFILD